MSTDDAFVTDRRKTCWPAEWQPHRACFILFPHNAAVSELSHTRREIATLVQHIIHDGQERVILGCVDQDALLAGQQLLSSVAPDMLEYVVIASNDTWARDTGPTFVVQHDSLVGLNWQFNAYGGDPSLGGHGCYWPCDLDQEVAPALCRHLQIACYDVPIILEGGAIHTDGQGTVLTTEECLLARNPDKSRDEIEHLVLQATGCQRMIWLPTGLAFDVDTNGHVDNWACFVAPATVVLAWTDNVTHDPHNYERCRQSIEVLERSRDAHGRLLAIHRLYLPRPMFYSARHVDAIMVPQSSSSSCVVPRQVGGRMAASYVNFYISNKAVLVPQFGDAVADALALATLWPLFPGRNVVGVSSGHILGGGGNLHCVTQQIPDV